MRLRRDAALFSGLVACGLAWSALADPLAVTAAPKAPALVEAAEPAAAPSPEPVSSRLDLPPPDLPAPVAIAPAEAPAPAGSEAAIAVAGRPVIAVPPPPAVGPAFTPRDTVQGAIAAKLAEPGSVWPARLPRKEREALVAFYAERQGAPLWTDGAELLGRTENLAGTLARADADGLDPADYPMPVLAPGRAATAAELADAELKLSAVLVLYARDARGGRIEPSRLSALITPKLDLPSAGTVLARLAEAGEPGAALEFFQPPHAGYRALKAKLAALREQRPGIPSVRRRMGPELTTQAVAGLGDPSRPVAPLASPRLEGDILANMERWRWLPADLGQRYVAVNVPEFRLRLIENGAVAHETRVITGRAETPTPIFSGLMDHAVVNPSWYVPPSILKKEFLPGLAADPDYAAKRGYEVIRRKGQLSVRQPPGERNALGFIKFMFPNDHAVYLHDTPNRTLFGSARRAFSHGCVRVENPFALADFVLGHEWSEARLKRLIGRGERTITLPLKLPVHLTYFTVDVDPAGEMRSFEDLYGYNRRVRQALGLGG